MVEEADPPVELATREEGSGPVVILLHGIGGSHLVWNEVIPLLAREFHVLAPDLRGHGRTTAPPSSHFTFAELEGDVREFLDLHAVKASHVVGLSGGALLALRLALDRPDGARSLTMISGAAYTDPHTRAVAERWEETYAREGPDAFALRVLKDLYYPDWIEAHLDFADQLRAVAQKMDLGPAIQWARAMRVFDERARVGGLRMPTLIIQAMDDAVIDASHGRILRQSIPGAQIRIFPQTGHMIPLERPAETAEAIAAFVRSVEAKAAAPETG